MLASPDDGRRSGKSCLVLACALGLAGCAADAAAERAARDALARAEQAGRELDALAAERDERLPWELHVRQARAALDEGSFEEAADLADQASAAVERVEAERSEARATVLERLAEVRALSAEARAEPDAPVDFEALFEEVRARVEQSERAFDEERFEAALAPLDEAAALLRHRRQVFPAAPEPPPLPPGGEVRASDAAPREPPASDRAAADEAASGSVLERLRNALRRDGR